MSDAPHLEVGRISKPHGLQGEVVVALLSDRVERVRSGSILWSGDRVLTVASSRPHQGKHLVRFEGVERREDADQLRGLVLTAPPIEDDDELWVHDLIGRPVLDTTGALLGHVESVEANPASDLLVLGDGGLIPLTFMVEITPDGIIVDPPEGLLELNAD